MRAGLQEQPGACYTASPMEKNMLIEVKVPQLPESVSEATLMTWHKKVGEFVKRDENLIDLETDKVVLELPAPQAGVLVKIIESNGASVASGQLLAQIDTEAAASDVVAQAAAEPTAGVSASVMPSAAKLAAEANVDLGHVAGSGRDGRILKEDVAAATRTSQPAAKPAAPAQAGPLLARTVPAAGSALATTPSAINVSEILADRPEQRGPMSRLRQRVAERLVMSQQTNAILTTFNEVNMKPVMDLRARYKDKFEKEHGVKLGFMSFFVKAVVSALKKFPVVNSSVDGNDIIYHGYFDIGIAVGSPRGLVVPILRNADQLSIAEIEKLIAEFAVKARDGKLSLEDLTGGTFSITNGGTFGSMMSTPIINPPQSAILGMHATKDRAVVENGEVVVRPMMYLALSYDHRIIDGREAVLTLVTIKDLLEDPARLILDL